MGNIRESRCEGAIQMSDTNFALLIDYVIILTLCLFALLVPPSLGLQRPAQPHPWQRRAGQKPRTTMGCVGRYPHRSSPAKAYGQTGMRYFSYYCTFVPTKPRSILWLLRHAVLPWLFCLPGADERGSPSISPSYTYSTGSSSAPHSALVLCMASLGMRDACFRKFLENLTHCS